MKEGIKDSPNPMTKFAAKANPPAIRKSVYHDTFLPGFSRCFPHANVQRIAQTIMAM